MKDARVIVKNETGLHSRPADTFVRTAKTYRSDITVKKGDKTANAKAILKVVLLNVKQGDEIVLVVNGEDEAEALEGLRSLLESEAFMNM